MAGITVVSSFFPRKDMAGTPTVAVEKKPLWPLLQPEIQAAAVDQGISLSYTPDPSSGRVTT